MKTNIDYEDLTEEDKKKIWKELIGIVEETEFKKYFTEMYMDED